MTSPLDNGSRWAVLGVTVFILSCAALVTDPARALALINESPSLPRGIYLRRPDSQLMVGAVVATPQSAIARAYLGALGMPGDVLLIKRVAAGPGDAVCRIGDRIRIPRRSVAVPIRDRRGAILPTWSGCRRLGAGEVFLLGDTPTSFDSRYFGPVAIADIEGVYREFVTW